MYEVRPEGTFLRVDHDQSLARAVSKAEQLAALNRRRYVVVQVVSVHVAEPNERYIQRYGRANRAIEGKPKVLDFEGTVTGSLRDYQVQAIDAAKRLTAGFAIPSDRTEPEPVVAKALPELVVTRNGVPFADQTEGLRQFKEACGIKPADAPTTKTEAIACHRCGFWHLSTNPCLLPTGR